VKAVGAKERFRRYRPSGSLAEGPPEYFVVTDLADLDRQPDLRRLLRGSLVVRRTPDPDGRLTAFFPNEERGRSRAPRAVAQPGM
jgi:hypothetical protein